MDVQLTRIQAFVYRAPIQTPVQTSFGIMRDRPAVFVRVTDQDGQTGWGEVWCNFPTVGAEHRARLIDSVFAPLLLGQPFASPKAAFDHLSERTSVLAIQSAEPGPIAQCIAGIDIALWDLHARRIGQPLWRLLGGESGTVGAYASGLNPTDPETLAGRCLEEGHRAFKLKVGFGIDRDIANLKALRARIGALPLMIDANQAWDLDEAIANARLFSKWGPAWLEEPLRADRPWKEWRRLADASPIALAAGENLGSESAFDEAMASRTLSVIQPDLAKWGGFSGCLPVAKRIVAMGMRFCPHYLGAGVGLLASAHLLAATGGDGILEIDANANPLRSLTCAPLARVVEGKVSLSDEPGLGASPDLAALERFAVTY